MSSDTARPTLQYVSAGRRVERRLDGDYVRIGRSPELELVFPETESGISRHHATITRDGDTWFVEDAKSRNGTYVNGERIDRSALKDGDRIDLGPFLLHFHLLSEAPRIVNRETSVGPTKPLSGRGPEAIFSQFASGAASASISLRAVEDSVDFGEGSVIDMEKSGSSSGSINRDQAWAITMFKEVGQALLISTNLDEMLETVMVLAFTHVAAERGVICLRGEDGTLDPRVVRSDKDGERTVEFSQSIVNEAVNTQTAVLVKNAVDDERFSDAMSIVQRSVRSAICVPLYHAGRTAGVIYVDSANRNEPFRESHLELLVGLGLFAAIAISQFELRENAISARLQREKLARYHAPAVVERILQDEADDAGMLATKEEVTILFADIKGFTAMSETLSATEVVDILNAVFGRLVQSVFRFQGTLDKFMGDGMLSYFGAPLKLENHALATIRAALEMQQTIDEINRDGLVPREIKIRIGINSGPVVVGDVGSTQQSNHTVIGDSVNVASRLESSVAQPGEIIISEETFKAVRDLVVCERIGPFSLKGKTEPVYPYRVTGLVEEPAS